jgi:hypothetical protein
LCGRTGGPNGSWLHVSPPGRGRTAPDPASLLRSESR